MVIPNQYKKIVPFIVFILALILLFFLVKSMITILLGSILLAYIAFPIYKRILKKKPKKTFSIVLSLFIVVVIILVPFSFLAFKVVEQGSSLYHSLTDNVAKGALFGISCVSADSKVCSAINSVEKLSLGTLSKYGLDKELQKLLPIIEEKVTAFFMQLPLIIAGIVLTIIIAYFLLKDWENILKKITNLLPMRKKTIDKLIKQFRDLTHTVIYAQLFVALAQGIVGTIGFYIFGVPFPIFFGLLMAFCSLIPFVGTGIIWAPASLFLILTGFVSHNYWTLGKGIGLLLYGILIINTIDDFLLAKIVHTKAKVNQILVIVGVLGGASLFGVIGIFIGPILLPLLITYFQTFKERFN